MAGATSDTSYETSTSSLVLDKDGELSQRSTLISKFDSVEREFILNRSCAILESQNEGPSYSIDHEPDLFEFIKSQEMLLQRLEARLKGIIDPIRRIEELAEVYKFRRPNEVYAFLSEEQSAVSLISDAKRVIREYFPKDEIFMEVLADPNSPNEKELLISISTSLPPEEAISRLDAFDDNWWLCASTSSTADICIKVEYR